MRICPWKATFRPTCPASFRVRFCLWESSPKWMKRTTMCSIAVHWTTSISSWWCSRLEETEKYLQIELAVWMARRLDHGILMVQQQNVSCTVRVKFSTFVFQTHNAANFVQCVWESPLQFCSMLMGKPVRAHQPKRVNNYEWAHDRPTASAANTNMGPWQVLLILMNGPIISLSMLVNGPITGATVIYIDGRIMYLKKCCQCP